MSLSGGMLRQRDHGDDRAPQDAASSPAVAIPANGIQRRNSDSVRGSAMAIATTTATEQQMVKVVDIQRFMVPPPAAQMAAAALRKIPSTLNHKAK